MSGDCGRAASAAHSSVLRSWTFLEKDVYKRQIYVDGKLKIYDCSHIKPDETDMERLGYMEGHLTNGTIYVYAGRIEDALPERLNAMRCV